MKESDIRNRETFNEYIRLSELDIKKYFSEKDKYYSINCPACGKNGKAFLEKKSFNYDCCESCNTFYVSPRPPLEQFESYYVDSPSTSYWVEYFFKPMIEARREKMFKPRAVFIADYIKNENLRIGDIGAGFGLFLSELKKVKPNNYFVAIEPSVEMAKICKEEGLEVLSKLLEDIEGGENSFDILTAFELFEHLNDPKDFVLKVNELLAPGGLFLFTTLNGLGFDIQTLMAQSKSISPPHHLNFFNPRSVELLLSDCGFDIIEVATPGKLDWDIVEGMIKNENAVVDSFWKTFAKQGSQEAKENLQQWLTESGLSSHMRVVAKKRS